MGPIERWFFSVDFSIPKFSKDLIKPSVAPTADATRLKDKDFFIGVNLALGDLLVDRESRLQRRALWQELVLKFHVTPSNRPWETWGAGFGLRGDRLKALLWNMDVVHPFVTVLRKETEEGGRWAVTGGFAFDPRSLQRK